MQTDRDRQREKQVKVVVEHSNVFLELPLKEMKKRVVVANEGDAAKEQQRFGEFKKEEKKKRRTTTNKMKEEENMKMEKEKREKNRANKLDGWSALLWCAKEDQPNRSSCWLVPFAPEQNNGHFAQSRALKPQPEPKF